MQQTSAALILFILLSSLPTEAVAQTQAALEKGKRVRVTAMEGRIFTRLRSLDPQGPREVRNWVDGPVWSWNDSILTVEAEGPGPDWTLSFASIDRLETRVGRPLGTRRGLEYGVPIGAIAGFVIGVIPNFGGELDKISGGFLFAGLGGLAGMAVGALVGSEIEVDSWQEVHLPVGDSFPKQPLFPRGSRVRVRVAGPAILVDPISGAGITVSPESEEAVTGTLESIRDDSLFIHLDDFETTVPVEIRSVTRLETSLGPSSTVGRNFTGGFIGGFLGGGLFGLLVDDPEWALFWSGFGGSLGGFVGLVIGLKPREQWEVVSLPEVHPIFGLTPEGGFSFGLSIPLRR